MSQPEDWSFQLYELGREAMVRREYEAALAFLRSSVELLPHFKTLELLGECLLESGHVSSEAVTILAAAAGLGNRAFRSYFLLARALHVCGRTKEALEKLDIALVLQPDFKAAAQLREELLRHGRNSL